MKCRHMPKLFETRLSRARKHYHSGRHQQKHHRKPFLRAKAREYGRAEQAQSEGHNRNSLGPKIYQNQAHPARRLGPPQTARGSTKALRQGANLLNTSVAIGTHARLSIQRHSLSYHYGSDDREGGVAKPRQSGDHIHGVCVEPSMPLKSLHGLLYLR